MELTVLQLWTRSTGEPGLQTRAVWAGGSDGCLSKQPSCCIAYHHKSVDKQGQIASGQVLLL